MKTLGSGRISADALPVSSVELRPLLDGLVDTDEVVIRRLIPGDGLLAVWRAAAYDSRCAWADRCSDPCPATRAVHVAAEDRADAAFEVLRAVTRPAGA